MARIAIITDLLIPALLNVINHCSPCVISHIAVAVPITASDNCKAMLHNFTHAFEILIAIFKIILKEDIYFLN